MAIDSNKVLIGALRQHCLLDPDQLDEVQQKIQVRFADPRALAKELISRDWLTPYQVNQLFQDNAGGLVLGSYLILERLGEGGMGQVFKARHLHMDRIVAVKVIKPSLVNDPRALKRFQREMQTSALLVHPHIVMAFDADLVGNTYFFVMEYVEGVDLGKLIKEAGPPPVGQTCDYMRQAALGLQYAHERGMVHRDIKPANLLVTGVPDTSRPTPPGATPLQRHLVKILDMGLARLVAPDADDGSVTQLGKGVGTPDYMAPEQARSTHNLDIRADLYSLGCTFYFLLTGRVPFPGGTGVEKMLRHQAEEAVPVEKLRADVPAGVAGIVRKLMAKRPKDRYQTPAELVNALIVVMGLQGRRSALAPSGFAPATPPVPVGVLTPKTPAHSAAQPEPPSSRRKIKPKAQKRFAIWLWIMGVLLLATVGLLVWVLVWMGRGANTRATELPATARVVASSSTSQVWLVWNNQH